ncbi:M50 family metallopeptidase [Pseudonocardia eucalypti]|uniref:M50 family metallopeptidase n=1 Tax=Pseudonocardia eucalypti TaxID=648755 RepID=A0ABP9QQ38_9PSEU|nr:hypothetical protein [Pseudonocardia eucalypti]
MAAQQLSTLVAPLVALVLVAHGGLWRICRTAVTIAHEGGHAIAAVLTGRRLSGIRLHSDTSGVTVSVGRTRGPGMVFTSFAGYPAPALVGLLAAWLVTERFTRVLLWAGVLFLLATLVYVRNVFGVLAVLVTGGIVGAVAWYGSPPPQRLFCAALAWFLLLGGLRAVRELAAGRRWQLRRGRRELDSDADQLARLTGLPAWFWVGVFTLVALGALVLGGWWLLGDLAPLLLR